MLIYIATDHAGLEFSHQLQEHLTQSGYEVVDHGPSTFDPVDDYPSFCINAAQAVANDWSVGQPSLGIVLGGSGNGEQMAANKVTGIRAALVWNEATARLAREHNNANVMALGARQHTLEEAFALVDAFLEEPFPGDERHVRRIEQIREYETAGVIEGKELLPSTKGVVPAALQSDHASHRVE